MHKPSETPTANSPDCAHQRFEGDVAIGASLVWSRDSRARFNNSAVAQNQRVLGLDWSSS